MWSDAFYSHATWAFIVARGKNLQRGGRHACLNGWALILKKPHMKSPAPPFATRLSPHRENRLNSEHAHGLRLVRYFSIAANMKFLTALRRKNHGSARKSPFPGLREKALFTMCATPVTIERETAKRRERLQGGRYEPQNAR
jgi:hypothetical protein